MNPSEVETAEGHGQLLVRSLHAVRHVETLIKARRYVLDSDWGDVQPNTAAENAYLDKRSSLPCPIAAARRQIVIVMTPDKVFPSERFETAKRGYRLFHS